MLENPDIQNQDLLEEMNIYWKENNISGVTGKIKFNKNGDLIESSTEIVKVKKVKNIYKWQIDEITKNS